MQPETLKVLVDAAQVLSGLAAAVGLVIAGSSMRQQSRATDVSTLLSSLEKLSQAESKLHATKDDKEEFGREFLNYVNLLEILASCANAKTFGKISTRTVTNRLVEDLAILQSKPAATVLLAEAVDSPETFSELRKFITSNRQAFDTAKKRRTHA